MKEKKRILVVDDDVAIGEMLQTLLEFNGFEAVVSDKPQKTEENIEKYDIDLILLDMRLSGVNGTDVCASLKGQKSTKIVPVLMMSALSDAGSACKAAGADDFISKPFEMNELLAKISTVLTA